MPDPEALIAEFARFVEFWCGAPDRAEPELDNRLPAALRMVVLLNESRSARPFDADDRLLGADKLRVDEDGAVTFLDIHQYGEVLHARIDERTGQHMAVLDYGSDPAREIAPLPEFLVTWGLQQLVFTAPEELHEVDLLPVCAQFEFPGQLLWSGRTWPDADPVSFHLLNRQILAMSRPGTESFNGYTAMDGEFCRAIKSVYPAIRDEYLPC